MEQSSTHNPRIDDELKHELDGVLKGEGQTRTEEWRQVEPVGEDQPDIDRNPAGDLVGGTPRGITPEDIRLRTELAAALRPSIWPATREEIIQVAEENHAPTQTLELLQGASEQTYQNLRELCQDIGIGVEEH